MEKVELRRENRMAAVEIDDRRSRAEDAREKIEAVGDEREEEDGGEMADKG